VIFLTGFSILGWHIQNSTRITRVTRHSPGLRPICPISKECDNSKIERELTQVEI